MKGFEKIMSIGNVNLGGLVLEESPNSPLITAKQKIYVPEKKIILMDQVSEQESQFLMSITKTKEGLII